MRVNQKRWIACALLLLLAVGCRSIPEASRMTPQSFLLEQLHRGSVHVVVEKTPRARGQGSLGEPVSMQALEIAVRDSIEKSGLFEAVTDRRPDYVLTVTVFDFAIDLREFRRQISAEWKLVERESLEPLYHEALTGTYRSNTGDALNGITRITMSREGSVRDLIAQGLEEISRVPLTPAP